MKYGLVKITMHELNKQVPYITMWVCYDLNIPYGYISFWALFSSCRIWFSHHKRPPCKSATVHGGGWMNKNVPQAVKFCEKLSVTGGGWLGLCVAIAKQGGEGVDRTALWLDLIGVFGCDGCRYGGVGWIAASHALHYSTLPSNI